MKQFRPGGRLASLTASDWAALTRLLQQRRFDVAFASVAESVSPEVLVAVVLCIEADSVGRARWVIFHGCEDHPIDERPFRTGLPSVPFQCPECDEQVESQDELSVDVACILPEPLEIVRD